jgi:hypothetical protein
VANTFSFSKVEGGGAKKVLACLEKGVVNKLRTPNLERGMVKKERFSIAGKGRGQKVYFSMAELGRGQ